GRGGTAGGSGAAGRSAGGASGAAETGGAAGFGPCPPAGTACVILPLGDSITYGYGSTTGGGYRVDLFSAAVAAGKSITFVGSQASGPTTVAGKPFPKGNEGHSGYSIDDSSKTSGISGAITDDAIRNDRPNIILLMIGTNDMHDALDVGNAPTRLGRLMDEILADAPGALLVVATIIPANGSQNTPTQTYNAALPALIQARAGKGKHVIGVDMYAAMKSWSTTLYKDSEHPNDAGYSIMANVWFGAIRSFIP
ncbi:MAG TPA: SGNH/GDSL hydrolase family protein, partial [Polyangia bacterium]|nr:SGNH/GDSL hydrolase family protein [Polyangia bacterium]